MSVKNAKKTVVGSIDPEVLKFTVGDDPELDLRLVEWDCYGTAAHVIMLSRMKADFTIVSREDRINVVRQLAKIRDSARAGTFKITPEDQDCHLAIERTLTEALGEVGKRIHTGRSRNDQSATAIRMFLREELDRTVFDTLDLAEALAKFGRRFGLTPMVGRTHLQPAMPSSVGAWASAWAEELLDGVGIVESARALADRCPLGSAASYGVPLPINRNLTARLLGFSRPVHNVLAAGNSRGKVEAAAVAALSQTMITLSRMAQDLILFSMPEFGYFSLPKEFCTGSSIMPQKYNPDVCELVRSKAARVVALSTAASGIMVGMPGGYNRDLQDTKKIVMEAVDTTRACLVVLTRLVRGLKVDSHRLRAAFDDPGVFATDRALQLVAGGMPFRDAYHEVRDHLEDLRGMDPDAALAAKTHLGAPAVIDYEHLFEDISFTRTMWRSRNSRVRQNLMNLLH